jgi:hypothetical protein
VPFVQWALGPQSLASEHGHEAWFAKQRPPVQWSSGPQSLASLHSRAPVVGHSCADGSFDGGGAPWPHAAASATTRNAAAVITMVEVFIRGRRIYQKDACADSRAVRPCSTGGRDVLTNPDPYDDDDDHPTLQRPAPTSTKVAVAAPSSAGFLDESTTATDLHVLSTLPSSDTAETVLDELDYADMETPKIPLDIAAVLLRASLDDEDN